MLDRGRNTLPNHHKHRRTSCLQQYEKASFPYSYLFNYLNSSEHTGFENGKLVQNTDRFGFEKLLTYVISEYGSRSMVISPIVYPYWENIARSYEDLCGFLLLIEIFLILFIAVFIISFLNLLFKKVMLSNF